MTLEEALKYNSDNASLMVKRLEQEIAEGSDAIHNHHNATRLITADALDDLGREQEAKFLREQGPFRIADGKVIAQRYTKPWSRDTDTANHYNRAIDSVNRITDWNVDWDHTPTFFSLDTREHGDQPADGEKVFSEHDFPVHGLLGVHPYDHTVDGPSEKPSHAVHVTQAAAELRKHLNELVAPYIDGAEVQDVENLNNHLDALARNPITVDIHPAATTRLPSREQQ